MTPDEIKDVLVRHAAYLRGEVGGVCADLSGADLRYANLNSANLIGANLNSADLSGADLNSASLRGANLNSADLRYANLNSADLSGADLNSASLRGADLRGADLRRTGAMRVLHGDYEVTLYPGADLSYGCERHSLAHWREHVEAITARHVHIESLRATKVRELRALFDLCDAIQQPKEPTP